MPWRPFDEGAPPWAFGGKIAWCWPWRGGLWPSELFSLSFNFVLGAQFRVYVVIMILFLLMFVGYCG